MRSQSPRFRAGVRSIVRRQRRTFLLEMTLQKYEPKAEDTARDVNNFLHHPPHGDQAERYEGNRQDAINLATNLLTRCPPSRALSLALTHLEEVVFWANAAIARNEKPS